MITQDFLLKARIAIELQQSRIGISNRIYASIVEQHIRAHPDYTKLLTLRKDKTKDRKETAKLGKKLLKEQLRVEGISEDELNLYYEEVLRNYIPFQTLHTAEKEAFKILKPELEVEPLYKHWLKNVKGMGIINSIKLLCYIRDIKRFPNPSKLRKYCGTAPDMKKRRGIEAHFVPALKGLMLGQIATQFLRNGSQYKQVYDDKKAEYIATHVEDLKATEEKKKKKQKITKEDWTKMKIHNYAIKAMINRFLIDLWVAGWKVEDLEPPVTPYILVFPQHNPEPMIVPVKKQTNQTIIV